MSDLSPQARGLLSRVSSVDGPTRADRDRVLALVSAGVAGGAAAAGSAGVGAAAGSSAGVAKLVIAFVVSVGIGGTLTVAGTRALRAPSSVVAPVPRAPVTRAVPPAPAPLPVVAEPVLEPAPSPVVQIPVAVVRTRSPVAAPTPEPATKPEPSPTPEVPAPVAALPRLDDGCALSAELVVVQRAQQELKADPAAALAVLDGFDARCHAGTLVEERLATRALALCLGGQKEQGRLQAEQLASRFGASPSLPRVRQACGQ